MHPILNIAIRAARKAGNIIVKSYENPNALQIDTKTANDFATNIDRAAEEAIIDIIKKAYPDHSIIGEESGESQGQNSDVQWIIDPIDGTTNFIRGIPRFCVSIAVLVKGRGEVGVIYDPMCNELFTAVRGQGAKLNDRRIRVSQTKGIENSLLAIAFPFKYKQYSENYFQVIQKLFAHCSDFRRTGAAALDLAYLAAGRLDGFFIIGIKHWDMAAGEIILREAGGILTDFAGGNDYLKSENLIAGNPKVVKDLVLFTQDEWDERLKV